MQMVSINIHPGGVARENEFARSDEYAYLCLLVVPALRVLN